MEAAVAFLLTEGLPVLWRGVDEIRRAKDHILAHGTTDDRMWFEACPVLEVALAGSGDRRYVVRILDGLLREAGVLAATLGLPASQILILGLMAGLVGAEIVPPQDRAAVVTTLRAFRRLVERRADRARTLAASTPVTDSAMSETFWTLDDFDDE